jgi:hypothetical protein
LKEHVFHINEKQRFRVGQVAQQIQKWSPTSYFPECFFGASSGGLLCPEWSKKQCKMVGLSVAFGMKLLIFFVVIGSENGGERKNQNKPRLVKGRMDS